MWVKICANTNVEDALLAAQLGADAVGFVFAPSARHVTAEQVAQITAHLPQGVHRVGIFPAWDAEQITLTVAKAGLTAVQLHAAFDRQLVRSLHESLAPEIKLIQAVHWAVQTSQAAEIGSQLEEIKASGLIDWILVDSKVGEATGGTGIPFDWIAAEAIFRGHANLILAGGLRPQNVREAIERLKPYGVDVASGVEATAGRKDLDRLKSFIKEAKSSGA